MPSPDDPISTGHDVHFLSRLDRVKVAQADTALGLYRNPELVRAIFADTAVPAHAERIAIPIAADAEPPLVVIARSGAFITCLGPGMRSDDLPTLPWPRVAMHLERDALRRAREQELRSVVDDRDTSQLLARVFKAGSRLTREEMRDLVVLAPVFGGDYRKHFAWAVRTMVEAAPPLARLRRPRPGDDKALRAYWRLHHAVGHLVLLAGGSDRDVIEALAEAHGDRPSALALFLLPASFGSMPLALRSAWGVARAGKPIIPTLKQTLESAADLGSWYAAALGAVALASRHARLRNEALGLLSAARVPRDLHAAADEEWVRGLRNAVAARIAETPDDPAHVEQWLTSHFRDLLDASLGSAEVEESGAAYLANVPLNYLAVDRGFDVALQLAVPLARLAPERLYLPASAIHLSGSYSPEASLELAQIFAPPEPVRTAPKPGRNAPCSCGSGKKYKKCCG